MRTRLAVGLGALCLSAVFSGCTGAAGSRARIPSMSSPDTAAAAISDACLVVPASDSPRDTVTIGSTTSIRPWRIPGLGDSLPWIGPTGLREGERLVHAQTYETLVRVTCDGRVVPGLAASWSTGDSVRWHFELDGDARFSDGTPVTTSHVVAGWQSREAIVGSAGSLLRPIEEVSAESDRSLSVTLGARAVEGVRLFAHRSLAVLSVGALESWPRGTGAYVIEGSATDGPTTMRPVDPSAHPPVRLLIDTTGDARDLLDAGVDLLETRDARAVDYAGRNRSFMVHALPWSRTYALLVPARQREHAPVGPRPLDTAPAQRFRAELARDAVRSGARPAEGPYWWQDVERCWGMRDNRLLAFPLTPRRRAVVFAADDPIARDLAERIVAVAARSAAGDPAALALGDIAPELMGSGSMAPRAVGLSRTELSSAWLAADELAYVLAIPHRTLAPCLDWRNVELATASWFPPQSILPLVDTHAFLVARVGAPAVIVDWDGSLRLHPVIRRP